MEIVAVDFDVKTEKLASRTKCLLEKEKDESRLSAFSAAPSLIQATI